MEPLYDYVSELQVVICTQTLFDITYILIGLSNNLLEIN